MADTKNHFNPPGRIATIVNRVFGWIAASGLGPNYSYLLQVNGRKSGIVYSTPVNLLQHRERLYLVGTRGHTQWSRNAQAAGFVTLRRGRQKYTHRVRQISNDDKPEILKAYLVRFNWMVSRFFPVASDAPMSAFANLASDYPVFELLPMN